MSRAIGRMFVASSQYFAAMCVASMLISSSGDVIINEFVAGNASGLKDESGETQDWIELYNGGTVAVELLGWSLTDERDRPDKWTFPSHRLNPGEFLVVFASGKDKRTSTRTNNFHTNFKLDLAGEYLALGKPGLPRATASEFAPKFPEQRNNYSYGLDNSNQWRYFQKPTPGSSNGVSAILGIVPAPKFSVERGIFDAPFSVSITVPLEMVVIRYTTNGSEPTSTSGQIYDSPLRITNTSTIRAAAFKQGYLSGRAQTHSYLFLDQIIRQPNNPPGFPNHWGASPGFPGQRVPADYEMDSDPLRADPNNSSSPIDPVKLQRYKDGLRELPFVSLVLKTDDMFGAGGLYPSGREAPVKQSNEKPCSVEMLLPDGKSAFAITCGIDLHGNASRNPMKSPKHGFKLAFKSVYGESDLKYRLFPDSPAKSFDDLILRPDFGISWLHWSDSPHYELGAMQRTRAARIRDPWFKNTFRDMGQVASHSRFCHLFINGLYWGVYDFTEQPTDSLAQNYFGGQKTDYDVYDQGALKSGTTGALNTMLRISDLANNSSYEAMKRVLDITEFIDYTLLHFFAGHQDWGYRKNWYAIRKRVAGPEGAFKFIPWDGENLLLDEDIDRVSNPDVPLGLHTKLLANAEYRLAFADRVFKHMLAPGGALTPAANVARWRKWQAIVDKPIVAESLRWGDYRRDVHRAFDGRFALYTRESHWLAENSRILSSYLIKRNATVLKQLRAASLYPAVEPPSFNQQGGKISPGFKLTISAAKGTIHYTTNGVDPRVSGTGTVIPEAVTYAGAPVTLTTNVTIKARALTGRNWSALNEAFFVTGP